MTGHDYTVVYTHQSDGWIVGDVPGCTVDRIDETILSLDREVTADDLRAFAERLESQRPVRVTSVTATLDMWTEPVCVEFDDAGAQAMAAGLNAAAQQVTR